MSQSPSENTKATEPAKPGMIRFRVIPAEEGLTLRSLLARRLPDLPKEKSLWLIHAGAVYVNRLRVRLGTVRMAAGERVTAYLEALDRPRLSPSELKIVHREDSFMVLDKPAGVPVDPTKSSVFGCLSDAVIQFLEQEGMTRPYVGVVHRLDQPASGLVLLTTRSALNKSIHQLFVEHQIHRHYRALCWGDVPETQSCVAPILERQGASSEIGRVGQTGARDAKTDFVRLAQRKDSATGRAQSLVQAKLSTGRHHQIRVHAAHLGHPIVGDVRYDPDLVKLEQSERQTLHLHAYELAFTHPLTKADLCVQSTLPAWAKTS